MRRKGSFTLVHWATAYSPRPTTGDLRASVLQAVSLHFEAATPRPRLVQLHYVKDELIPLEAA